MSRDTVVIHCVWYALYVLKKKGSLGLGLLQKFPVPQDGDTDQTRVKHPKLLQNKDAHYTWIQLLSEVSDDKY